MNLGWLANSGKLRFLCNFPRRPRSGFFEKIHFWDPFLAIRGGLMGKREWPKLISCRADLWKMYVSSFPSRYPISQHSSCFSSFLFCMAALFASLSRPLFNFHSLSLMSLLCTKLWLLPKEANNIHNSMNSNQKLRNDTKVSRWSLQFVLYFLVMEFPKAKQRFWTISFPALLQKLVGDFFLFFGGKFCGKFGGNFCSIFSDPQWRLKFEKLQGKIRSIFRGTFCSSNKKTFVQTSFCRRATLTIS